MNVLPLTWAFKCKHFLDGNICKLNAWFCIQGDYQINCVDVFNTYAPVVAWTMICMLVILLVALNLQTKQVEYMLAFMQVPINENVFMEMPQGLK
jgi:hypothetical protein